MNKRKIVKDKYTTSLHNRYCQLLFTHFFE